ncbi:hypothetical protein D3C76_395740 [compost metagenome]
MGLRAEDRRRGEWLFGLLRSPSRRSGDPASPLQMYALHCGIGLVCDDVSTATTLYVSTDLFSCCIRYRSAKHLLMVARRFGDDDHYLREYGGLMGVA